MPDAVTEVRVARYSRPSEREEDADARGEAERGDVDAQRWTLVEVAPTVRHACNRRHEPSGGHRTNQDPSYVGQSCDYVIGIGLLVNGHGTCGQMHYIVGL